jgi:tRNA U38,U39,U40 pseudouridine synthase TruA
MDPNTCGHGDLMDEKELFQSSDGSIAKSQDPSIPLYYICFEFIANGFLRHMVRRIIGTLRPIGEGTFPASHVLEVLASKSEAGPSAPSKGLWLDRSWLTQEEWDNDFSSAYVRAKIGR